MNYIYKPKPVLGKCVLGVQAGPQTIVVRQVIGEAEAQKSLDFHICVPRHKPAIEQVIDAFVKKLRVTDVRIIPNKVIVCGDFEIKAIYVACLPDQPVHAVELRRVRFTVDVPIWGARCGMDADASVYVEYVDYDCPHHRAKPFHGKGKYGHGHCDDGHDHCGHGHDHCDDEHEHCGYHDHEEHCHHDHKPCCKPNCAPCHCPEEKCFREFDVAVVLKVVVKVMGDREIVIYPGQFPGLPVFPKG